ncbi:MAG TPA: hypothetical protein PKD24_03555 [Pyrinomonadaceae bacterium]|nr:hypothetical protein [Pyrinomonadaceae bacterium]HMP64627.1 hypothetical protein [Pyrinomonadaceae bacterium]
MEKEDIHMGFRDVASVSLLFAALERIFPHFLSHNTKSDVDSVGKVEADKVFRILRDFSTTFPQTSVDNKNQ